MRGPLAIAEVGEAVSLPAGEPHAAGRAGAGPAAGASRSRPPAAAAAGGAERRPAAAPSRARRARRARRAGPPPRVEQPTEVMRPVDDEPANGEAQPVAQPSGERGEP